MEATTMDLANDMVPTKPLWWVAVYHVDIATEPNLDPDAATMQDPMIDLFLPPCCRSPCQETILV